MGLSGPTGRGRGRWWFWAAGYSYLVLLAGTNVPTPLYRGYEQDFGFSPVVVTLVFASYVATLMPALLVVGPLSDAAGRRRVLVPAIALAVGGCVLFLFADGTPWLFAARCVQGVAVGAASGAVVAALADLEPVGDRRRAALVATLAPVVGIGVGPLLSGLLAQYAPAPHLTPYLVEIALLLAALVVMAAAPDAVRRSRWRPRRPEVPVAIRGVFATSAACSFLAWAVAGLFLALIPSYLVTLTRVDNLAFGGGVVAVMLGCSAVAQRLGYARRPETVQRIGLALLVVGLVVLILAGGYGSLTLLLTATVIAGTGHGLAFLGAMTEINRVAPTERHAEVVSSFLVATYAGTGLPVIGAGILATALGLLPAVRIFALAVAALCLLVLVVHLVAGGGRAPARQPGGSPAPTDPA